MGTNKKVAIVTGGSHGIGKQIVIDLMNHGYAVSVIDINKIEFEVDYFYHGDIKDKEVLNDFYLNTIKHFGQVDVLINNACYGKGGILSDASYEDFDEVLSVGLKAPYYLSLLCKDELIKIQGSIINIASSRAFQSEPNSEAYASVKGGIVALTHSLAMSLAPNVKVNAIAPGWINTHNDEISEIDKASIPVGKVGSVQDISDVVLFLLNQAFITGETIVVDGGMSKRMIYHNEHGWSYGNH